MKIFVAGARSITELDDDMQQRVNSICDKDNDIIVGDSYGVDAAVQELCAKRVYNKVTVYASNGEAPSKYPESAAKRQKARGKAQHRHGLFLL